MDYQFPEKQHKPVKHWVNRTQDGGTFHYTTDWQQRIAQSELLPILNFVIRRDISEGREVFSWVEGESLGFEDSSTNIESKLDKPGEHGDKPAKLHEFRGFEFAGAATEVQTSGSSDLCEKTTEEEDKVAKDSKLDDQLVTQKEGDDICYHLIPRIYHRYPLTWLLTTKEKQRVSPRPHDKERQEQVEKFILNPSPDAPMPCPRKDCHQFLMIKVKPDKEEKIRFAKLVYKGNLKAISQAEGCMYNSLDKKMPVLTLDEVEEAAKSFSRLNSDPIYEGKMPKWMVADIYENKYGSHKAEECSHPRCALAI